MPTEQQLIEFMRERLYKPMTADELVEAFDLESDEDVQAFIDVMETMEERGLIIQTRTKRYGLPEKMNLVVGRLDVKSKGFGFVVPNEGGQDVYVHSGDLAGAMNGDRVIVRVQKKSGGTRPEGAIIRILTRANTRIVGTLKKQRDFGFVIPDDRRLGQEFFVPQEHLGGAEDGDKVVIEIVSYAEAWRAAEGHITEVLGRPDDPGVDIVSVIRKHGLPEAFPEHVLQAAESVPEDIHPDELTGRRDLRAGRIVTIDGEDAKDLDDAVCVERLENGNYLLGVHIADVAYYVKEGSALDVEAYQRGCSVYLVDRVIPMLPHRLSNGICSLNPQVDRLTLSCEMEWSPDLRLVRHNIFPSVIRTTERMTYTNVRKILEGEDADLLERYKDLVDDFRLMETLAMKLRDRRMHRGAVDFDFQETKIIVDEEGHPTEIRKRERSVAEQIIEEFMLAANECVAEHFHWMQAPFVYRVHEDPSMEKLMAFNELIHNFGYHLKGAGGSRVHPRALQELLEKVKGEPEERIVSTVMLRSMKQARYAAESLGHFGLAAEYYTHFTSPIRRYPDLVVHRIIREIVVGGGLSEKRHAHLMTALPEVTLHCSQRERVAVDAERETDTLKKIEFMLDKAGEEFDGIISGVTSFGLFVELDNSVEGLIHVSYLDDDYYHFHEKQYALIGERTGRTFRIGDSVRILVAGVNKTELSIDFRLAEGADATNVRHLRGARRDHDRLASGGSRPAGTDDRETAQRGRSRGGKEERGRSKGKGNDKNKKVAKARKGKDKGKDADISRARAWSFGSGKGGYSGAGAGQAGGGMPSTDDFAVQSGIKTERTGGDQKKTVVATPGLKRTRSKSRRPAHGPDTSYDRVDPDLMKLDAVKLWEPEKKTRRRAEEPARQRTRRKAAHQASDQDGSLTSGQSRSRGTPSSAPEAREAKRTRSRKSDSRTSEDTATERHTPVTRDPAIGKGAAATLGSTTNRVTTTRGAASATTGATPTADGDGEVILFKPNPHRAKEGKRKTKVK